MNLIPEEVKTLPGANRVAEVVDNGRSSKFVKYAAEQQLNAERARVTEKTSRPTLDPNASIVKAF